MANWSVRCVSVTAAVVLLSIVGTACARNPQDPVETPATIETTTTATTRVLASSPTTLRPGSGDVQLLRVDPATLTPLPGSDPITSGDWISGSVSENGQWLVLNVWIDTEPDTDVVRVVEASTGRVVTDVAGPLMHELRVGNDGTVYNHFDNEACGGRVGQLAPGETSLVTVFEAFPDGFCSSTPMTLLDDKRAGWLGTVVTDSASHQATLLIGDLSNGSASMVKVPTATLGPVGEQDVGDWVVVESLEPAVVWDVERNRALVVHADQPVVSVVDLGTGEVTDHVWSGQTSWVDGLLAWLIPAANAKGPASGISRSAVLSPGGDVLYVGTQQSKLVVADDGEWSVEASPQGVDVINTESWKVIAHLDVPASQVSLSPDGHHLVATGVAVTDTLSTSSLDSKGAFIVSTDTLELVGRVATPEWHPDIQYSANSKYAYLGGLGGGLIRIVELETGQMTDIVANAAQLTVFGEVAMLSTRSEP